MEGMINRIVGAQFTFSQGWVGWFALIAGIVLVLGAYMAISAVVWGNVMGGLRATTRKPGDFIGKMLLIGLAFVFFFPGGVLLLGPIYLGPKIEEIFHSSQQKALEKALAVETNPE
jgi:hypothetical protein